MYSEKSHRMPSLQFPSEIRVHENEYELARRKQKISENPTFRDDIEFISSQLDLIKRQRDIYKALLEQFEASMTLQEQEVKRCQSVQVENSLINQIKENEGNLMTDKGLIDPLSPSYGKELGDRIDRLNLQIKNLKHTFEEKSHAGSPLPQEFRETIISSHHSPVRLQSPLKNQKKSRLLKKNISQKRPKSSDVPPKLSPFQKKLHSKTFCTTPTKFLDAHPYKHSFCNVQAQLEYFPTRIRQLEQENRELERILERLNQKEMTQSTLSLDRPLKNHRKTTQNLDVKRKELEHLQRQLEEKSKALENKEKELNQREMVLNRASTKGKKPKEKEDKRVIKNTITISNISGPEKNSDVHYEEQNQLKKIRRESNEKEKKDEEPEKGYACKVCRVF